MAEAEDTRDWARERRRMRWREAAWLLLAAAGLTWLIVGSVRAEVERARERYASDSLQALAGHVSLAMHRAVQRGEDPRAWRFPLVGPGKPTPGVNAAAGTPLAELLPEAGWLEPDPWGRSYAVILVGAERAPYPLVITAGPEGLPFDPAAASRRWTAPLLWPTAR